MAAIEDVLASTDEEDENEGEDISIQQWLDNIRKGYGERFGHILEAHGCTRASHLAHLDHSTLQEVNAALKEIPGSKVSTRRRIRIALRAHYAVIDGAELSDSDEPSPNLATEDAHPPATRAPPSASFPTMVSSSNGEHTIQQQVADGWVAVVSRTRPGQVTYKHIETGARTGKIPTLLNQQGIIDRSLHVVNMRNKKGRSGAGEGI